MSVCKSKLWTKRNERINYLFCLISILFFIEPAFIYQGPYEQLHKFYLLMQLSLSLIIIVLFFLKCAHRTLQPLTICIFTYEAYCLIVTLLKQGDVRQATINAFYIISISLLMEAELASHPKAIVNAIEKVFLLYTVINFVTFLLFPGGMYRNQIGYYKCWFLGFKNIPVPILLVGVSISQYRTSVLGKKFRLSTFCIILFSLLYVILAKTATGILVIALFTVYIVIRTFKRKQLFRFSHSLFVIGNLIIFVLLVFCRVQEHLPLISGMTSMLGKEVTFTGRSGIWDKLSLIWLSSPVIGVGVHDSDFYVSATNYWAGVHAHSHYFQVMIEGGVIGLILFFIILLVSVSKPKKKAVDNEKIEVLIVGVFLYLLAMQMEMYSQILTLFILLETVYYGNRNCSGYYFGKRFSRTMGECQSLTQSSHSYSL